MMKLIIIVAFLCLGLVSTRGFRDHGRSGGNKYRERERGYHFYGQRTGYYYHGGFNEDNRNTVSSILCTNTTLAQLYVTQVQAIITQFINNGSFTDWLQQHAQEMAYFQSDANTVLLSSNCTGYFRGVDVVRALDTTAQNQREQYTKIANGLFEDILLNLVGYFRDDSHEK
ncbi:unnamed protein product [Rotaria sp. Silwood2]|nr:unnamed protein product [Rotaria sp. Silwood2]CAF4374513.1 unnamed protein product [Rotaria sp. Silwood2]